MLNTFTFSLPDGINSSLSESLAVFKESGTVKRIWNKDASVWSDSGEDIWLGWLDIVAKERDEDEKYRVLAADIKRSDFESIVLLGMGGSSLCPEVFSITFGKKYFHILDSTVPAQIKALESKVNVATTLFIVASKSGSTLEPNTFKQYFYKLVCDVVGEEKAGNHFVAITDPGSKLEQVAKEDGFWKIFYGDPTVGGRFSALSVFGMVPAACMGIDVPSFLNSAMEMVESTQNPEPERNPALVLGAILGLCHKHGRDKLTILTSPEIYDVGAWMEQLVAESTGKNGVAIIPVDREEVLSAREYSADRVFACLTLNGDTRFDDLKTQLESAGHPTISIDLAGIETLGQEFFRWEFATAVAGALMEINPFDQPDVEAAKIEAKKITEAYEQTGKLPDETPFRSVDGFDYFGDESLANALEDSADTTEEILTAHLARITPNDYFALLAYVEMNDETEKLLQKVRDSVLRKHNVATCLGFGPRFLHSTGQAYKGGANNGVFVQITSDDARDFQVPEQDFTFGIVKAAQSRGDFQVLLDRGRRALRIHIGPDVVSGLKKLVAEFEKL